MAVKSITEIMDAVRERIGESTDDATLEFIGDLQDTLTDFDTRTKDATDWKQKYEDNDNEWRKKYRDRFFSGSNDDSSADEDEGDDLLKPLRYEDLFTQGVK